MAEKMGAAAAALLLLSMAFLSCGTSTALGRQLKFGSKRGEFKILQVADMHYADGKSSPCEDVSPRQMPTCSDLNTTAFIRRLILAEKPDFIVFSGLFLLHPTSYSCFVEEF